MRESLHDKEKLMKRGLRIRNLIVFALICSIMLSEPGVMQAAELNSNEAGTEIATEAQAACTVSDTSAENNAAITISQENEVSQPDAVCESDNEVPVSESDNGIEGDMSDVSVTGSSSLGQMLSEGIASKESQEIQNNGYNVFSIAVSGSKATVNYETRSDCTLLVCIYNEANTKLLASGKLEVSENSTDASVTIDTGTIPDYFFIRGYLIDTDSLRPLSTEYSSPMYTQEMQGFLAKKTTDFDTDKVINLDNSESNNFVVAAADTQVIPEDTGYNQVTSEDLNNQVYVFENADENIKSLQVDDTFVYQVSENNILVIKVAQIAINGNRVTITGKQISLDEAFSYIKIDGSKNVENAQADTSNLSDGVTYNGLNSNEGNTGGEEAAGFEGDASTGKSQSYGFDTGTFSGSVDLKLDASVKYYLTLSYQYVEVKLDWSIGAQAKMDLHAEQEFALADLSYDIYGIVLSVTPKLDIKSDITATISAKVFGTIGASWDSDSGFQDLTTSPKLETEWKIEGDVYIGVSIDPSVAILDKHVANVTIEGKAGVDISGAMSSDTGDTDEIKHDCGTECIAGEIDAVVNCTATVSVFDNKVFEKSCDPIQYKISDWYCSLKYGDFAFTTCPHKSYKVTVVVKDTDGKAVEGCSVSENGTVLAMTDSQGMAELYINAGKYQLNFGKSGLEGNSKDIKITDEAKKIEVRLTKDKSVSENYIIDNDIANKISCGGNHTAVITKDGSLYTWGANDYGQLGNGKNIDVHIPQKIMPEKKFEAVSCYSYNTAAITTDGSLYVWGENSHGQIGDNSTISSNVPKQIMPNTKFKEVSCGKNYTAAITTDGRLYTWGANSFGALGDGTTVERHSPKIIMPEIKFVSIACGGGELPGHTAAITTDGRLFLWGYNSYGELGNGLSVLSLVPIEIMPGTKFSMVSCAVNNTAAITKNGTLFIWGRNNCGQLGNGTKISSSSPQKLMPDTKFIDVSVGSTTVALTTDGILYSWGDNFRGALGNGSNVEDSTVPIKIVLNRKLISVSNSYQFAFSVTENGEFYAWGGNVYGQLGDGTTTNRLTPTLITIPSSSTSSTAEAITSAKAVGSDALLKPRYYSESTTSGVAAFTGLSADSLYNIYDLKSESANDALSGDNILTVSQASADENGNLSISYEQRESFTGDKVFAVGQYGPNIADADIMVPSISYNGAEQIAEPVVKYNGITLDEGIDYEVYGQFSAAKAGTYTLIIKGIGAYIGSKSVTYSIIGENADICTVSFNSQGGSSVASQTYSKNENFKSPAEPTKDGYDFTGWFTGKNGGTKYDEDTLITESVTLYAHWVSKLVSASAVDLSASETVISSIRNYIYTGNHIEPALTVKYGKTKLEEGVDYTVSYNNNIAAGTATATINGIINYKGKASQSFLILPKKLKQSKVEVFVPDAVISGNKADPEISIFDSSRNEYLQQGNDFTVEYSNDSGVGKGRAIITAEGNYTGSMTKKYNIYPAGTKLVGDLIFSLGSDADSYYGYELQSVRTLTSVSFDYTGKAKRPSVVVKDESGMEIDRKFYSVSYKNNKNAGKGAYAVVKGRRGYMGVANMYFTIKQASISNNAVMFNWISGRTYTGSALTPKPTVTHMSSGRRLANNRDYRLKYSGNVDAGEATITVIGMGNYTGTAHTTFDIQQREMQKVRVKNLTAEPYTGSQIKPTEYLVYCGRHQLKEGRDFTVDYGSNIEKGKGQITLIGIGNMTGSVTKSFRIK